MFLSHDIPQPLKRILSTSPKTLDLTNEAHLEQVLASADQIFDLYPDREGLEKVERELLADKDSVPLLPHLAVKLAKSKRIIASMPGRTHVSIVFAMYKEHNRLKTREEHEHGENLLIRKIHQLNWLFADQANFTWDLSAVDDGCPEHSGDIARQIFESQYEGDNVRVLFLQQGIEKGLAVTQPLASTAESQKGGSIHYGLWQAAQQRRESNHIILFTDADLSTHLGQIGLLIDGIVNQGKDVAIGSRREETSVVVKKGLRNIRGKLFIYLWKRLIPDLNYIVDTQCGFKAFRAETVRTIIDDLIEKKFAFDIELLLKAELNRSHSISRVAIAWIDSEAASTTTDLQPYLPMLKAIVRMYRTYLPENSESESFAQLIQSLDEEAWNAIIEKMPAEIANGDPAEFGTFNEVKASALRTLIAG
ncbi:MAG: hypothetical protein ACE5IY_21345 [bacterium]